MLLTGMWTCAAGTDALDTGLGLPERQRRPWQLPEGPAPPTEGKEDLGGACAQGSCAFTLHLPLRMSYNHAVLSQFSDVILYPSCVHAMLAPSRSWCLSLLDDDAAAHHLRIHHA